MFFCGPVVAAAATTLPVKLVVTRLALPSAIAAAKSSWSAQAMEDVLPASAIVVWAWLLSAVCKFESIVHGSNSSTKLSSCGGRPTGACQCKFSQLAFSQVALLAKVVCFACTADSVPAVMLRCLTKSMSDRLQLCNEAYCMQARFESMWTAFATLSLLTWAAGCSSAFVACGAWSAYRVGYFILAQRHG